MFESKALTFAVGLICLLYFARPSLAFGAGNIASISKIEGQNCTYRPRFARCPRQTPSSTGFLPIAVHRD